MINILTCRYHVRDALFFASSFFFYTAGTRTMGALALCFGLELLGKSQRGELLGRRRRPIWSMCLPPIDLRNPCVIRQPSTAFRPREGSVLSLLWLLYQAITIGLGALPLLRYIWETTDWIDTTLNNCYKKLFISFGVDRNIDLMQNIPLQRLFFN